jgi:penicillin-binding protein 1C
MKLFGFSFHKKRWWEKIEIRRWWKSFLAFWARLYHSWLAWTLWQKIVSGVVLVLVIVGIGWFFHDLPSPTKLSGGEYPVSTQIFDRNGKLLYEVYADEHRTPIQLKSLPVYVAQASIAIEDKEFYKHWGFSAQGIIRALKNTFFANKLQGGSTITQQLVKTALLSPERTITRKIREAVLTVATEVLYSKDQILEMYLNHIPYGGTAYGIEAAAQRYFGKSAKDLTLPEAALLAGLPQAPSRYSPFVNPEQARLRQHEVLRRMFEEKYITQQQLTDALQTPLTYIKPATDIRAPHFVFYIKSLLEDKYGIQKVERGGLRVKTTLDLDIQNYAQASIAAELEDSEKYKITNGAALVTRPDTGEILAMVGSKDYFDTEHDGQVNLTMRLRQPGSSIKPINYVTALQNKQLTASSILLDIPTCFQVTGQNLYCPKNYDGSFHGPVSFRNALANSYNIPAVKVLAINGLETMMATASAMGITTLTDPTQYGLSLTLGGGEVTMADMVTAFGTLANQGVRVPLNPILEVSDYTGKIYESYDPSVVSAELNGYFNENDPASNIVGETRMSLYRALNREPAYIVDDIMADNNARSAAFGSNSKLKIKGKTVSVKTGTTNDIRDNWTIGFTPDVVVATWVGNNDGSAMNSYLVSGVTGAAPIWNDIMSYVLKDLPDSLQPKPSNIETISVCNQTGSSPAAGVDCTAHQEYFWSERLPDAPTVEKKNIWVQGGTDQPAFFGSTTSKETEPTSTDGLELKEHTVMQDPFTRDYCLDCQLQLDEKGKPIYPQVTVDMNAFYWFGSIGTSDEVLSVPVHRGGDGETNTTENAQ